MPLMWCWILEAEENEEDNCCTASPHCTKPSTDGVLARSEGSLNGHQRLSIGSKSKTWFSDRNLSPLSHENLFFSFRIVAIIDVHFLEFSPCFLFLSSNTGSLFPSFIYTLSLEKYWIIPSHDLSEWKSTQIHYLEDGTNCLHYLAISLLQESIMNKLQKETNDLTDLTVFNHFPPSTAFIPLCYFSSEAYTDQTNMGYVLSVKVLGSLKSSRSPANKDISCWT